MFAAQSDKKKEEENMHLFGTIQSNELLDQKSNANMFAAQNDKKEKEDNMHDKKKKKQQQQKEENVHRKKINCNEIKNRFTYNDVEHENKVQWKEKTKNIEIISIKIYLYLLKF